MSTNPVQIVAELECKPGQEDAVRQRATAFVEHVRAQPGCLSAALHRIDEAARFLVVIEFTDDEALQAHLDSAWRRGTIADLPDLLAGWPRRYTTRRVA